MPGTGEVMGPGAQVPLRQQRTGRMLPGLPEGARRHQSASSPRKTLQVKIVDDEEYEKKDNFFIELGQPQWLKRGISGEECRVGCGRKGAQG